MRRLPSGTEEGLRLVRDVFRRLAASWYLFPFALAMFVCTLVWVVRPEPEEAGPHLSMEERYRRGMRAYKNAMRLSGPASLSPRTELMKEALLHLRTLEAQYGVPPEMFEAHKAMGDLHLAFAALASKETPVPGGLDWNLEEADREYREFLGLVAKKEAWREAACSRAETLVELGEHEAALAILEDVLRQIGRAQVDALLDEKRTGVRSERERAPLQKEIAAKARLVAGRARVGLGREDEAKAELERFLASGGGTHEERSRGSLLLAQLLLRRHSSLDRARELFLDSPGPEARLGLARIEFALGNYSRALEILARSPHLPGKWGRAADYLASLCFLKEHKPREAARGFSRLARLEPSSPEGVASVVGLAEAAIGARLKTAKEDLEKACRLGPPAAYDSVELPERDERLARAHLRGLLLRLAAEKEQMAGYEECFDLLRLAWGQGLPEEEFARAASRVLAKKGEPGDLIRSAELLLRLRDADSILLASRRFREGGDPAGAAHACGLFVRFFPGDARASRVRHDLGLSLRELGLFSRAVETFRANSPRATERARDPYAYESAVESARTRAVRADLEPSREKEFLLAASDAYGSIISDPRFEKESMIFAVARLEWAGVAARLGDESAERLLSAALRRLPSKDARPLLGEQLRRRAPGVCVEVGHLRRKKGDFSRAAEWYARARELGAGAEADLFEALAARALTETERSDELLRLAREKARAEGDDALATLADRLAQSAKVGRLDMSILKHAAGPGGSAEVVGEEAH